MGRREKKQGAEFNVKVKIGIALSLTLGSG